VKSKAPESTLMSIYTILVIAAVLLVLIYAKDICIPIALAALLAFVLAPLVTKLDRWVGRIASVVLVLVAVSTCTAVMGYILSQQLLDLSTKLPDYHSSIQKKVTGFTKETGGQYDRLSRAVEAIRLDLPGSGTSVKISQSSTTATAAPLNVTVVEPESGITDGVQAVIGPILTAFALAGLVLLLTVFMLLHREDIRGRFIRLAGHGRISLATTAMAEAGSRVFRYLVMQLLVNAGFGLAVAIGLYAIGVPNAPLWGALATVLRFIPYVGPWIAACLPILLSMAVSDGWTMVMLTVALFVVLELITNNVMEPWLYGASTGVSSLALILAAIFWGWMWGPIGLVLATPLTVCLVVMGHHIPRLSFLSILLSDEAALLPHEECYHRLLRADLTEGLALVERYLKAHSLTSLYDDVLIPVLLSAEADHHLEELDRDHRAALHQGIRDVLEDLALRARSSVIREETAGEGAEAGSGDHRRHVLCLPVRATRDELAAMMMTHVLREKGCDSQELSAQETASELVEAVAQRSPDAVCISVVAPSAMVHARNLCMKLRTRFPDLPLVIGFWGNHLDKATLVSAFAQWPLVTVVESIDEASLVLAGTKSSETSDDVAPAHGSTRHVSDAPLRPIAAI